MITVKVLRPCTRCNGSGQIPILYTLADCDMCKGQKVYPQFVGSAPGTRMTFDKDLIIKSEETIIVEYEVDL